MSWLVKTLANSLKLDDEVDDHEHTEIQITHTDSDNRTEDPNLLDAEFKSPRGVKEDLSEITKTLTRQFWDVASFLAPPPQYGASGSSDFSSRDAHEGIEGKRSDFVEIRGKFKNGISRISRNRTFTAISKIASNFLELGLEVKGSEDDGYVNYGVVGLNDEVVLFARSIAMHPGTWLDFPFPGDKCEDFDMSNIQQEHVLAVERLTPRLAALRIELCPAYMSEAQFWKIYFVLLHPKLNKQDAELLSTDQIVEARVVLQYEPRAINEPNPESGLPGKCISDLKEIVETQLSAATQSFEHPWATEFESEASTVSVEFDTRCQIIDKCIVEHGSNNHTKCQNSSSGSSSKAPDNKYEDNGDDRLRKDDNSVVGNGISGITTHVEEEDVSFSDLEEDEDVPNKKITYGTDSSTNNSREWIQLSKSGGSSDAISDWLDMDDNDAV